MMLRGPIAVHGGWMVVALLGLLQSSCVPPERTARASEPAAAGVSREPERCELGALESVSRCGGALAACHVCARLDGESAVCVQPCAIGGNDCPPGQACHPIGELRDGGGYARIGDCPAGYCR
jgi:hypothetical protein